MPEAQESPAAKEQTLFDAVRALHAVTIEIEVKIFGKQPEETKEAVTGDFNVITRARDRIMEDVETLRKVNRVLRNIDKE